MTGELSQLPIGEDVPRTAVQEGCDHVFPEGAHQPIIHPYGLL
ncbi:MAG: hypothetical protein WBU92_07385 [Candidatus Dormiibacterota bacterium]